MSEAECVSNAILAKFPHDSVANFVFGLAVLHYGHHSYAITLFRNALRADPDNVEAQQALETAIRTMRAAKPHDVCVIGNSHTGLFKPIQDVSVFWVGPVTMRRLGKEGTKFLDYRNFGIGAGATVVAVFGEIDVRAHFMKRSDGSDRSIAEVADSLVSSYLRTLAEAFKISGAQRQIVASLPPPFREGIQVKHESIGDVHQRVAVTVAVNERFRFGCQLLGFGYLDLYTPFANEAGALAEQFTEDGFHIHINQAGLAAQELRKLL